MRFFLCLVAFLTLLGIPSRGLAQSAPVDGEQEKISGHISGQVIVAGQPGAGITVLAFRVTETVTYSPSYAPVARATTDEMGQYDLAGLAPGLYYVDVSDPGLIRVRISELRPNDFWYRPMIRVVHGKVTGGVTLDLIRGGVITGRVLGPEGQPVSGRLMDITAVAPDGHERPARLPGGRAVVTDDSGGYVVRGLPPGSYKVGVLGNAHLQEAILYPFGYYPGTTDKRTALPVQVQSGLETTGIDIRLASTVQPHQASGRMIDAETGKPVPNLRFLLQSTARYSHPNGTQHADSNGMFELRDLPPGHYSLLVTPPGSSGLYYSDRVTFDIAGRDLAGLKIKLHRTKTVTGTLAFSEISPPDPQAGVPRFQDIHLNAWLSSRSLDVGTRCEATVGADGSLAITGVVPGTLILSVDRDKSPKGFSVVRLERDGVDLALDSVNPPGFIVKPGDAINGLRVVVGYGDVTLRGRVKSSQGILPDGVMVRVEAKPLSRDAPHSQAEADWQGRFTLQGLSNGDYELTFAYNPKGVPGGIKKQRVTVAGGQAPTISVELPLER